MTALLIDGSGLAYRSYYAFVRNPLRNTAGEETSLTFGFLNTLLGVLQRYQPQQAAVVFDTPGRKFRHQIDPDYKAGRPPMPESMASQLPRLRQALALLRLPVLEEPLVEADDVIGTLATHFAAAGESVWLLTADKDFFQLLSERVRIIRFKRIAGDLQEYGPAEFFTDTELVPEQMVDYLALCGDSVDNVPGIAGIGDKTARALIREHGTLQQLLDRAETIDKPGLRRKLLEGRETALRSRQLVRIETDVPLQTQLEDLQWQGPDWQGLRTLLRELEFLQLLKSLPQALENVERVLRVHLLEDDAAAQRAAADLQAHDTWALHTVTRLQDSREGELRALVVAAGDDAFVFPVAGSSKDPAAPATLFDDQPASGGFSTERLQTLLRPLLQRPDGTLVGSDLKHDLMLLGGDDLPQAARLFDTMVADWLLHPSRRDHELPAATLEHLQQHLPSLGEHAGIAGRDHAAASPRQIAEWGGLAAAALLRLAERMHPLLAAEELEKLFTSVEMPLLRVLLDMQRAGVRIDRTRLGKLSAELEQRTQELAEGIQAAAGHAFNIQSPKQLGTVLFEELGLPHGKRTRTGWSTDGDVLEKLAGEHELPRLVLEYRQLSKLQSTYTDALPKLVDARTGRIHPRFNQAVASTGRLSCSDPNLQNIPVRTELGRRIRAAFVPQNADDRLLAADYSQIELRIMAHLSQDRGLLQAFRDGGDIHTLTAARIRERPPEEIDAADRALAKTVNFGVLYGMGPRGLARQLGIDAGEARKFIDDYFATYPGVRAYTNHAVDQARTQGFVTTLLGRRLHLPDLASSHPAQRAFAERVAINAPIQGSAADLIKVAMVRVHRRLREEQLPARMILQVHDELLFECRAEAIEELRQLVTAEMQAAMKLSVPLVVDIGVGTNWEQAH